MRKYDVLVNGEGRIELVKQGFNWIAFWFTLVWALFKSNFRITFIIIGFLLILATIFKYINLEENMVTEIIGASLTFAFHLFFGLKGNEWTKKRLLNNKYKLIGSVTAEFLNDAIEESKDLANATNTWQAHPDIKEKISSREI